MQRAVSRSIIKEIKNQQSLESDVGDTCEYIAWNARKSMNDDKRR